MKKRFFAKLGHFFLVSALLFNSFGVAFVHAMPSEIIGISVNTTTLTEGDTNPISLVTIQNTSSTPINLTFTMSGDAVRSTDGTGDYELYVGEDSPFGDAGTNVISVPASGSVTFPINIIDDIQHENPESFGLTFESASYDDENRTPVEGFSSRGAINFIINDNDIVAPVFTSGSAIFTENAGNFGGGTASFTNNDSNTLDFHFEISGNASITDYVVSTTSQIVGSEITYIENSVELDNGTGIIKNVGANEKRRFLFQPIDDTDVEEEETVIITLTYATDSEGKIYDFADISHTTIIQDNDTVTAISNFGFETATSSVTEGNEGTSTTTIRLVADQVQTEDRSIWVKILDTSTATSTDDYTQATDVTNRFIVTMTSGTDYVDFDFIINGDITVETDETVDFVASAFSSETNFEADSNNSVHTLTILNDDESAGGTTNSAPTSIGEGIPDMKVVMGYGGMISSTTLASYFTDVDGDSLTFTATSSDPANIITMMDNGDLVILSTNDNVTNVEVIVTVDDGNGGVFEDTFVVSIIGNEVSFDMSSVEVNEDDGTYTVNLHSLKPAKDSGAGAPEGEIGNSTVIAYFQVNETSTATEDVDYAISADISNSEFAKLYVVEIPINSATTSFDITINDDSDIESLESISLFLVQGENTAYVNSDADTFVLNIDDNDSSTTPDDTTNPPTNTSSGGGSTLLSNTAPQAGLTTGQEVTIEVNKEITFDASGSSDAENNIVFYFWNFGDGSDEVYYTEPTTTHTYTEVGIYTLTTKVKDSYGEENSAEVIVHVVKGSSTPSTPENNGNTSENTNTETGITPENTTSTTPVEETGSTGTTNTETNTNNGSTNTENNTTEPNSGEEQNTTEENTENNNTPEETVSSTPENGDQNLPTWIKILFGSGALAAVAGAGLAINRVRKSV